MHMTEVRSILSLEVPVCKNEYQKKISEHVHNVRTAFLMLREIGISSKGQVLRKSHRLQLPPVGKNWRT